MEDDQNKTQKIFLLQKYERGRDKILSSPELYFWTGKMHILGLFSVLCFLKLFGDFVIIITAISSFKYVLAALVSLNV